ncbi:MAG: hypothetical protein A3F12_01440 [Gammaproteobacteria bacterium RIFCSPHIGHO2_12_FULL_38_14]|nr:MAG: hypothetical protein A3F12_01440 [Gammaproteobacteria bacterium RIFCSPHIGHO2_12_FULL_38_14]
MISLFGKISLLLALFFACIQSIAPLFGLPRNRIYLLALARPAAIGQFICILFAYSLLTIAFITNDFSMIYVALNSHPTLPLFYKITAVFGAHEGSILLWIFMLNIWTMIFSVYCPKTYKIYSITLAILGLISLSFLCFLIFTSNPFVLANEFLSGQDLNPLLQDPGLIIHPPMLYLGYVGFSVAFAITQAALLSNKMDEHWAKLTRQFATAAWCFLTLGILLGSWWAYRVLGWGGFWFWDPVENASLLPWLSGAALIHVLILVEKTGSAKAFAVFLALICFTLSVLGTFLVRSGLLISAHAFASDPKRGVFLLLLLGLLAVFALFLFLFRLPTLVSSKFSSSFFSRRETGLLLNGILLFTMMLTVLIGTLYPLILDAFHLGSISVGAPYFNTVMLPLAFILICLMAYFPLLPSQESKLKPPTFTFIKNFILSIALIFILLWSFAETIHFSLWVSLSLCLWMILNTFTQFRSSLAMTLAHLGLAILILGVLLSSTLSEEKDIRISVGSSATLGPYQFYFANISGTNGPNYRGVRAHFEITKNNHEVTQLYPEKRIYLVRDIVMTKAAINAGLFRDLYIALGEPLNQNDWSCRIYYKPFVRWIWFGGLMMMAGGVLSFYRKQNKRVHNSC